MEALNRLKFDGASIIDESEEENAMREWDRKILVESLPLLLKNSINAIPVNLINGFLLAAALWSVEQPLPIILWFGALVSVSCLRYADYTRWSKNFTKFSPVSMGRWSAIGAGVTGLIWGTSAFIFVDQISSIHFQLIIILIAGMSAGFTASCAVHLRTANAYNFAAILPISLFYFMGNTGIHLLMGIVSLMYLVLMHRFATILNASICDTIKQKLAIEELANTLSKKSSRLEKTIVEIEHAKCETETAAEAKSNFFAMISHEIRTPMNCIIGMASVLKRSKLTTQQGDHLDLIQNAGDSLLAIINDILDLSKLESGNMELNEDLFEPHHITKQATNMMAEEARQKGLMLHLNIDDDVPEILVGDDLRIRQVLLNLLGNAVKFTDNGSVTVHLSSEEREGVVTLRCEVIDTGIGISREAQDRLFTQFSQADSSISRNYGGTGLGLAICKQLVELMGGRIGVVSEEGFGARFWFTIECQNDMAVLKFPVKEAAPKEADALRKDIRMLIADANPVNQLVLTSMLQRTTAQFKFAEDVDTLRSALKEEQFDMVLFDRELPDFEEVPISDWSNSEMDPGDVPVVIAMVANAIDAEELEGVSDHLIKPVDVNVLYEKIREYCHADIVPEEIEAAAGDSEERESASLS